MVRKRQETGAGRKVLGFLGGFDYVQIIALVFLIAVGLVFIRSIGIQIGTPLALNAFGKQIQWVGGGIFLWVCGSLLNTRKVEYKALSVLFYLITIFLLILLIFVGARVYGARSWMDVPGTGLRLQPSEFTKLSLVMLLAAMFSTTMFSPNKFLCLVLSGLTMFVPFVLIFLEPDLGGALVLIPVYLAILFCSGFKWRYIAVISAVVVVLGTIGVLNEYYRVYPVLKPHQLVRIRAFLNPEEYLGGAGYQPYQAKLAVSSGGFFGKGIGEGTINSLGFLPHTAANNDFIFAIIAEETGFFGCALIFIAYLMLFYSILRTAFAADDPFGRYLCVGIGAIIFSQCVINIGVSLGLLPVTGLSLPFISYGGSFFLMLMGACGLAQSVYRHRNDSTV